MAAYVTPPLRTQHLIHRRSGGPPSPEGKATLSAIRQRRMIPPPKGEARGAGTVVGPMPASAQKRANAVRPYQKNHCRFVQRRVRRTYGADGGTGAPSPTIAWLSLWESCRQRRLRGSPEELIIPTPPKGESRKRVRA